MPIQEPLPAKYFPMNRTGGKGDLHLRRAAKKLQFDSMQVHTGFQACGRSNGNGPAAEEIDAKRLGALTAKVAKVRAGVDMTNHAVAASRAVNDDLHPWIRAVGDWI
jgi:hypothetical protein